MVAAPAVLTIWHRVHNPRAPTTPVPHLSTDTPNQRSRSTRSGITCWRKYRCRPGLPVVRCMECGSHAAAATVLRAGRVVRR